MSIRRNLLANNERIASVWIEGEVSGLRTYSSGHRYFTLKDANASINCVLFAFCLGGCDEGFKTTLAQGDDKVNGLKVQVVGELDLNMSRGQYSFKVARLRLAGVGDKMAAFNALKAKLEAEGLNKLDHPELRRPLPYLPHRIGIVTSPSGAVIHDMCDVIGRRFPNVEIRLYPAKVQGDGAVESIVAGIRFFNGELVNHDPGWVADVLIVGRGGGSVEDLWAFNEEPLVRAVAASRIPVVSAVGHESDVTLCDYVADLRAGTPSIAGERVVPVKSDLVAGVRDLSGRLARALRGAVEGRVQQLDFLSHRLATVPDAAAARAERTLGDLAHRLAAAPRGALAEVDRRMAGLAARLVPALKGGVARGERRVQGAALRLEPPMRRTLDRAESRVAALAQKLELLNPYAVLGRGYSITLDASGRPVRAAGDVKTGDRLMTRLGEGEVASVVVESEGEHGEDA